VGRNCFKRRSVGEIPAQAPGLFFNGGYNGRGAFGGGELGFQNGIELLFHRAQPVEGQQVIGAVVIGRTHERLEAVPVRGQQVGIIVDEGPQP